MQHSNALLTLTCAPGLGDVEDEEVSDDIEMPASPAKGGSSGGFATPPSTTDPAAEGCLGSK